MARFTNSAQSSRTQVDQYERSLRDYDPRYSADLLDGKKEKEAERFHHMRPQSEAAPYPPGPGSYSRTTLPSGPPGPGGPPTGDDLYKPKTAKFWLILAANFLAMFLVALDRTIVATAIPRITDDFGSLGDIGWYGSAYMLTTAASQLVFGRLYRHYNMKWVFLTSIVIFEAGSAICGAAPNSPILILGRAIAGLGSAGIFSGAMMIMIPMVPLHKRPMFQSMFGMVFGLASVAGPLVGGAFTSSALTWRWCFYINLPIGGFSLIFMLLFWNPPARKSVPAPLLTHIKRLDPLGTFFFIPCVVCLLLALQWGGTTYAWNSWRIIVLFSTSGALLIAFAIVQIMTPEFAAVPVRLITQRTVFFATCFTFFIAGSMLMLVYYLPIWFQTVKLISPLTSGIYTLPLVLALVVSSILNGVATQKIGYYVPAMLLSPSIMATGNGLLSTLSRDSSQGAWVGFQFLSGFGLGMGMQAGSLAVQTVLPMPDVPLGVALIFFSQQLGGAVFTTVGQTILSNVLSSRLSGISGVNPAEVVNDGATDLVKIVPVDDIDLVIGAYNYTLTKIFLAAMGLALLALLSAAGMEWKSIKKDQKKPGPAGASDAVESRPATPPPASRVQSMSEPKRRSQHSGKANFADVER